MTRLRNNTGLVRKVTFPSPEAKLKPLPRITDEIIEITPGVFLRSFSCAHLMHGTKLLPLPKLVERARSYTCERFGIVRAGLERLAGNARQMDDKRLLIRLIGHGQLYGLADSYPIADILWQMAVHLMDQLGIEHANDLTEK